MKKYSDIRGSFVNAASSAATKTKDFVIDNGGNITATGAVSIGVGYATAGVALATGSAAAMKAAVILYYGGIGAVVIGATGMIAKAIRDEKSE